MKLMFMINGVYMKWLRTRFFETLVKLRLNITGHYVFRTKFTSFYGFYNPQVRTPSIRIQNSFSSLDVNSLLSCRSYTFKEPKYRPPTLSNKCSSDKQGRVEQCSRKVKCFCSPYLLERIPPSYKCRIQHLLNFLIWSCFYLDDLNELL